MQHIWGYVQPTPTTPLTQKTNFGNFGPIWMKIGGEVRTTSTTFPPHSVVDPSAFHIFLYGLSSSIRHGQIFSCCYGVPGEKEVDWESSFHKFFPPPPLSPALSIDPLDVINQMEEGQKSQKKKRKNVMIKKEKKAKIRL